MMPFVARPPLTAFHVLAARRGATAAVLGATLLAAATSLHAQPVAAPTGDARPVVLTSTGAATTPERAALRDAANAEVPKLLATLETLVAIESGSRDLEGLAKVADVVQARLQAAGMAVQRLDLRTAQGQPVGPALLGTLQGTGVGDVLLLAHMDTVYPRGTLAKQPFRIDGDRAYGLAIVDDKGGVALIVHTVELLQRLGLRDYRTLTLLLNPDEEIGSPGSSALITQLGARSDAVFSYEGGGTERDWVRLATSSLASATMKVTGRASHAGAAPEAGRNALYEMAHQVLKTRTLGDPARGLKLNWTVAKAGEVRNVIPAEASAQADIRADRNEDLDEIEAALRAAVKERLIPDTRVDVDFTRGRPSFVANDASRALARHAVGVFAEFGRTLDVRDRPTGGGTDAAYAALRVRGGVLESFGLRGHGAHSNDAEYIAIDSIAPRLYLSTRMVLDAGRGVVAGVPASR